MSRPFSEYIAWMAEWTTWSRPLAKKVAAMMLAKLLEDRGLTLEEGKHAFRRYLEANFLSSARETVESIVAELEEVASSFEASQGRQPNAAELSYGAHLAAKAALDRETVADTDDLPF